MIFSLKKPLAALLAVFLLTASASTMATVTTFALEPHGTGLKMRNWLVNDPDYTFSEDYKSSVWYQNFTHLQLGENDRNNVLRIAISQLGYHEGDSTADFGGMNKNGTGNFIEYARLLVPHYKNNSYDWCACFVNWCLNQARFDKASSEISCGNWVSELKDMEMWQSSAAYGGTYTPKPADFIFFDWDETGQWPDHIGLVLYVTDTDVYTVEGNTKSDDVGLRSYPLNDKRVLGYGTPPYNEGNEPTMDFSLADGMPAGIYVVSGAEATLTDRDGQTLLGTVPIGASVTFLSEAENSVHVSYEGQTGYVPKSSLCLLTQSFSLTYHANGGKNPPDKLTAYQAVPFTLSQKTPTMQGDTFLGWSTVPYNCKVEYKAGDTIALKQDTVLYAVWEKYSQTLARQASLEGLVPEYERPSKIENSGALLLGVLNDESIFTDCTDTQLQITEDNADGKIPSFSSAGAGITSRATLNYKALCDSLELAPIAGENTAFVVLRVKDAAQSGLSLKLKFNGQTETASLPLASHANWQYLVFDLTNTGFAGDLQALQLEWQASAEATESQLMVSEIWLTSRAAVKDAILEGKYVYPTQPTVGQEPTPPQDGGNNGITTPDGSGTDTLSGEDGTDSAQADASTGEQTGDTSTQAASPNGGCTSSIGATVGAVAVCLLGAVAIMKKRQENDSSHH